MPRRNTVVPSSTLQVVPSSNYLMSGCSKVVVPSVYCRMLMGTRGMVLPFSSYQTNDRDRNKVVPNSNYPSGSYQVNPKKHGNLALREVRPLSWFRSSRGARWCPAATTPASATS